MKLNYSAKGAFVCLALASAAFFGCQKTSLNELDGAQSLKADKPSPSMSCNNYNVALVSSIYNAVTNQTTFTWTVTNANPGNGTNGTSQNLSHWILTLCPRATESIVSVSDASGVQVPASYIVDYSQTCTTSPVLKFNYGTDGSTPSTYTAVFSGNFGVGPMAITMKAGTACCTKTVQGVSCEPEAQVCSYSQGYWFANAAHSWNGQTVTLGGFTYNQAEGQALWATGPGGSAGSAKKVFYQASAIILSISTSDIPAEIAADIAIINAALGTLGAKLVPGVDPNVSAEAVAAAGRISSFICLHHCGSLEVDPTACATF